MNQDTLSTRMKFQKFPDISKFYKRVLNLGPRFTLQTINSSLFSYVREKRERIEKGQSDAEPQHIAPP